MTILRDRVRRKCCAATLLATLLSAGGCSGPASPTLPPPAWTRTLRAWSPYVGIIHDDDLLRPDSEEVFDEYATLCPEVKLFHVGNEVTTMLDESQINIEQYMDVLTRMYAHVVARYPGVVLVSQSTVGSGDSGANQLAAMSIKSRGCTLRRL